MREKKLEGISDMRDESDKSGMRVVIELKRGEVPEVVLNNLYKQTQLQDSFGMNMVALVDGQPRAAEPEADARVLPAPPARGGRRGARVFELRKARERGHILEGLAVALSNVDEIIALIKAAPTPAEAKRGADGARLALAAGRGDAARAPRRRRRARRGCRREFGLARDDGYRLSDAQAQAILEMRLQRLTGLEQDKIVGEYREVMDADRRPARHPGASPARVTQIIGDELTAIRDQFGDARRTRDRRADASTCQHRRPDRAARTWW